MVYQGGSRAWIPAAIDTIPVFIREQSILLLKEPEAYTDEKPGATVYAAVFGEYATCGYYNDDGETFRYEDGEYEERLLTYDHGKLMVESLHQGTAETTFCALTGKDIYRFIQENLELVQG